MIFGLGAMYLVKRQNWIEEFDKKYYLYASLVGAVAGAYVIYRTRSTKKANDLKLSTKKKKTNEE